MNLITVGFSSAFPSLSFKPLLSMLGSVQRLLQLPTPSTARPTFLLQVPGKDDGPQCRRAGCPACSVQMLGGPVSVAAECGHCIDFKLSHSVISVLPPFMFCFINVRLPPSVQKGHVHGEKVPSSSFRKAGTNVLAFVHKRKMF